MPLSYLILIAALLQNPAIREKQQEPTEHKREIPKQPPAATEKPIVPNSPLPTEKQKNSKEQSKSWPPPGPWDIYWPTLGLVIATGFAVRYAMRTVRAIKNQVDEMKKTAVQTDAMIHEATQQSIAAKKSADALINSERAWMLISVERYGSVWDYVLKVRNCGRTPGLITSYGWAGAGVPIEEKELPPLSHVSRQSIGLMLTPQPEHTIVLDHFEISSYLSPWWDEINAGKRTGIFEVAVKYTDILDRSQEHETVMVYSLKLSTSMLVNLQRYNRYT